MNTLTITLSKSAYKKALELAKSHGVPVVAYLSTEVEDLLDAKAQTGLNGNNYETINMLPATRPRQPNFSPVEPDTLKQILLVCGEVYREGNVPGDELFARHKYKESVRTVAAKLAILETTVRDKCSTDRRLGLPSVQVSTDWFVERLCRPEELLNHLCDKFPPFKEDIRRRFAQLLPDRFGEK